MKSIKERFLTYISYWTTSDESSTSCPSTEKQLGLARLLVDELKEMGVADVELDQGYVYAHLPASKDREGRKSMALVSHIDTAPDFNGNHVKPQVFEDYDGKDILLKGSGAVLSVKDFPDLQNLKGRTLITTDGTSLLGADDKAGLTAIMTALEQLTQEDLPHGELYIVFTPDEEIGRGPEHFSFDKVKADYGFTVDGDYEGEVAYENFNAAGAVITFHGNNVHPGEAKNIMKNAASIACEFQSLLPESETPEHTEGREGFYHLASMEGNCEEAKTSYIIRDHDSSKFEKRKEYLQAVSTFLNQKYGKDTVTLHIKDQYFNMLEVMKQHMDVVNLAKDAIRSVGLEPISLPIRGGTDGAMLSFKGLPCPNLGTGGYAFHGPYEHVTLEGIENVVKELLYLSQNPLA